MNIVKNIVKYICYYITGTAICTALWYLLFGRDDNGKNKLEKGGSNA